MSNVLIGIIGVILMIGLALAGALYLGDAFQSSENNSESAALSQGLNQLVQAAQMYRSHSGRRVQAGANIQTVLVDDGYLNAIPQNPVLTTSAGEPVFMTQFGNDTTGDAQIVVMEIDSRDTCLVLGKQSGLIAKTATAPFMTSYPPQHPVGCYQPNSTVGRLVALRYYAFARL